LQFNTYLFACFFAVVLAVHYSPLSWTPEFRGVALVEIQELGFYKASWRSQAKYVEAYRRGWRAIGAMIESRLASAMQAKLALRATLGIKTFGQWLDAGAWPNPPYVVMRPDRTSVADFSLADLPRERRRRIDRLEGWETEARDPQPWLEHALALEPYVEAIQARGGKVVYVRMPTCDERWEADDLLQPKARFWDQLAARTHAIAIHFKDDPELAGFGCPDTLHIDSRDAPAFTRRLLAILRMRGVFDAREVR